MLEGYHMVKCRLAQEVLIWIKQIMLRLVVLIMGSLLVLFLSNLLSYVFVYSTEELKKI